MEWLHQKCTLGAVTAAVFSFPSDTHHRDITHYISFTPPCWQQLRPEALCFLFACPLHGPFMWKRFITNILDLPKVHLDSRMRRLQFGGWRWLKVTAIAQNTFNSIIHKTGQTGSINRCFSQKPMVCYTVTWCHSKNEQKKKKKKIGPLVNPHDSETCGWTLTIFHIWLDAGPATLMLHSHLICGDVQLFSAVRLHMHVIPTVCQVIGGSKLAFSVDVSVNDCVCVLKALCRVQPT